jgi:hypothetical protein
MAGHLGVRSVVTAIILAGLSHPVAGEEAGGATIVVEVFDHAGFSAETVARAKNDVSRIYGDIGVGVLWADSVAKDGQGGPVIHLIIRPSATRSRVMGKALGDARTNGGTAFVYRNRVLDLARGRSVDKARVLAYALAHEMGHLLLPYPSHAVTGIMHEAWDGSELRDLTNGSLRFTPEQASAIRARASSFSAAALPDPPAPASASPQGLMSVRANEMPSD